MEPARWTWFGIPAEDAPLPHFAMPVERYMTAPVLSIHPDAPLTEAHGVIQREGVSSLPVLDDDARPVGLISRSDLLRAGRREAGLRREAALLTLPDRPVEAQMHGDVITVERQTPVSEACRRMVENRVHRVVVVDGDGRAVGVFSTRDAMSAIREKRLSLPLHRFMSAPVFTVRVNEPLSLATDRLAKAHVSGLVVMEDSWPVGVFTQVEALEARDLESGTVVESVMSPRFLSLGADTRMFRAADQAAALGARRVLAVHGPRVEGLLSGLDFARAAV